MDKVNKLMYIIDKNDSSVNCKVVVKLADDCKNGHQDFSLTATFWEVGKIRNDRNMITAGCCHEMILKHFPELKMFADLHLCDYKGIPTYATANGFYFITKGFERLKGKTQKKYFCDYYRVTPEQYDILKASGEQDYFGFLLVKLGIVDNWKQQADAAILWLEEKTGQKFLVDSVRDQLGLTAEKLKEVERLESEGYYDFDKIIQRKEDKIEALKKDLLQKAEKNYLEKLMALTADFEIEKLLINLFGKTSGVIFYKHTGEIVMNWYDNSHSEADFELFKSEALKNKLFEGLTFKFGK